MSIDMIVPYFIPLAFLLSFLVAYRINRTNLIAGILLTCSVLSFLGIVFIQTYASENPAARLLLALAMILFFLLTAFGVYFLIAFLVMNTVIVLRKERRSLKHVLTLVLAVGLLAVIITPYLTDTSSLPYTALTVIQAAYGLIIYYLIHLTQFIISMILCNFSRPRKNQDYIIVLGCWTKNGQVTPILARRIDKAIAFYSRQKETGTPPKLILSGGKGPDEPRPEAEAMSEYAAEKGIPKADLLLETRSVSTAENMRFSKEIMDRASDNKPYRCIYATNNYHVLRAGIFARKAGLKVSGIGAKTAFYYLPNAVLREYIAYLYIHLKWNIAFAAFSLVFGSFVLPAIVTLLAGA